MNARSLMGTSIAIAASLGLASAAFAQSSGTMGAGATGSDSTMQAGSSAGADASAQPGNSMSGMSSTTPGTTGSHKKMKKHGKSTSGMGATPGTGADMPPATNGSASGNTPSQQQH